MKRQMRAALCSSVALAAMAASVPVIAQEITSSIRGSVVDASGNAQVGVQVVVVHVPSGSRSTFTSNNSGAFVARGLRPGGPYTVTTVVDGNETVQYEGLVLNVSEPLPLTLYVAAAGSSFEEIEVTAARIQAIRAGGASSYGSGRISELPSIGRDIKDTIRQNPFVDVGTGSGAAISIGGGNNRFNSLTVDGVRQDDDFGLNGNGYPTQRSPISLDTVEQVGVSPAPFSVEFGKFTGGQINVVTKSGTNEFHGTAFYQYRNDSTAGDKSVTLDGEDFDVDLGDFSNKFYGATLGGPIIKDKLFFFAAYEKFEGSTPNTIGAEGSGFASEVQGVTQADVERIDQIASSVYGIDNQFSDTGGIPETDEKIFLKLDWNINDRHRAFASYQKTDGNSLSQTDHGGNRFSYKSHWYNRSEKLEAYNFQLFSDWSDNFTTEVKVSRKKNETGQVGLALDQGIGEIQINTDGGGRVYLGIDDSRHSNALNNTTWQAKFKAELLAGDHTMTFGYELDSVDVFNLFIQETRGEWRFGSIDEFEAGTPDFLIYQNAITNNPDDGAAEFNLTTHTLYLQDRWDVNDKLTLTYGLRADIYSQQKAPNENPNFIARHGFSNSTSLNHKSIIQPRLSFTYDIDDKTLVRGGVGKFGGGDPLVWVSNSYSLDGVTIDSEFTTDPAIINGLDFRSIPQVIQDALEPGNGNTSVIDPDYKVPSIWKMNLAVERYFDLGSLGEDWHFTAEAIWSRNKNPVDWKELRRSVIGTAIDGSPIYDQPGGFDLMLTNNTGGGSNVYAFSFDKSWDNGFSVFGSYTYTDAFIANEGTSSTAQSNFNFAAHLDRNNRAVGTSVFERPHQIKLGATMRKDFWEDNFTTVSLFYTGRSGRPYSITLDEFMQFGGDRSIDSGDGHLLYVPLEGEAAIAGSAGADSAKVVFADADVQADFNALVQNFGLKRGQSVDLQGERAPWTNDLDLRVSQEVPVGKYGKIELWLDMQNVLNFVNSGWGEVYESNFAQQAMVDANVDAASGQFTYTNVEAAPFLTFRDVDSVWTVQFGVKYKF
ncbi:TonB-dependent receptor [Kordiimonas lacus]|uniref:TonB-dependent Receptor Plug Domain n=1 Tax=Kordiimonas lacus TaxID=637679 RepID=A0A1G7B9P3_9PROT|nr:TonB-dependent receptor [Kordiimonas lacus]SDE23838.1 TonB-dependent Receptor Plug Domain [Kordiimonas lacus]